MIFANENLSLQNLFAVAGFYRRTFPSRLYAGSFRHAMRATSLPEGGFDKVATVVMGRKATDHMFFPRCRTKKQGACDAPYKRAVPCGFWIGRRLYYAVIYQETHARITRQNPL